MGIFLIPGFGGLFSHFAARLVSLQTSFIERGVRRVRLEFVGDLTLYIDAKHIFKSRTRTQDFHVFDHYLMDFMPCTTDGRLVSLGKTANSESQLIEQFDPELAASRFAVDMSKTGKTQSHQHVSLWFCQAQINSDKPFCLRPPYLRFPKPVFRPPHIQLTQAESSFIIWIGGAHSPRWTRGGSCVVFLTESWEIRVANNGHQKHPAEWWGHLAHDLLRSRSSTG